MAGDGASGAKQPAAPETPVVPILDRTQLDAAMEGRKGLK